MDHSDFENVDYMPAIEVLLKGGADTTAVSLFPTGNGRVDALLEKYGRRS